MRSFKCITNFHSTNPMTSNTSLPKTKSQEQFVTDSIPHSKSDSNERNVSDSFSSTPSRRDKKQTQIHYDHISCVREEDKKRNHTAPIPPRPTEFTYQDALEITGSFAKTGDKSSFEQLPNDLKMKSAFTTDDKRNTPLNISLITGQKGAFFEFFQLITNPSTSQQQLQSYLNYQNIQGRSSIHLAVLSNDEKILNSILDTKSVNVNVMDGGLRTIFHYLPRTRLRMPASLQKNPYAVFALDFHDCEGQTPVHIAIESGNPTVLESYISMGANLTISDKKTQHTPLQYAARIGNQQLIKMILTTGKYGEIDYQSPDGLTALYVAVGYNNLEAVSLLLQCGADPMILRFGNSILSYALENNEMTQLLSNYIKSEEKWFFLSSNIEYDDDVVVY